MHPGSIQKGGKMEHEQRGKFSAWRPRSGPCRQHFQSRPTARKAGKCSLLLGGPTTLQKGYLDCETTGNLPLRRKGWGLRIPDIVEFLSGRSYFKEASCSPDERWKVPRVRLWWAERRACGNTFAGLGRQNKTDRQRASRSLRVRTRDAELIIPLWLTPMGERIPQKETGMSLGKETHIFVSKLTHMSTTPPLREIENEQVNT